MYGWVQASVCGPDADGLALHGGHAQPLFFRFMGLSWCTFACTVHRTGPLPSCILRDTATHQTPPKKPLPCIEAMTRTLAQWMGKLISQA